MNRRNFFKNLGLATAGAFIAPSAIAALEKKEYSSAETVLYPKSDFKGVGLWLEVEKNKWVLLSRDVRLNSYVFNRDIIGSKHEDGWRTFIEGKRSVQFHLALNISLNFDMLSKTVYMIASSESNENNKYPLYATKGVISDIAISMPYFITQTELTIEGIGETQIILKPGN